MDSDSVEAVWETAPAELVGLAARLVRRWPKEAQRGRQRRGQRYVPVLDLSLGNGCAVLLTATLSGSVQASLVRDGKAIRRVSWAPHRWRAAEDWCAGCHAAASLVS